MKQTLQLRLGQHLTMTPQLQQAIRLLQLSTLDLKQEIQEVLDTNPMLEAEEESAREEGSQNEEHGEYRESTSYDNPEDERELNAGSDTMPEDLPVDSQWGDIYDSVLPPTTGTAGTYDDDQDFMVQCSGAQTLHDHLSWQLNLTPFSDLDRNIAVTIIDAVNEDGYLTTTLEEIHSALADDEVALDEVEAVLHRIQQFDPPGVAARNPRECLLLQLQQLPKETRWLDAALRLVGDYFDLLANQDHQQIKRQLKLSDDELSEVIRLIRTLSPHPGTAIADSQAQYVVPDVFVSKKNNRWVVELNPSVTPRLRINTDYAKLIRRADSSDANTYLKNHLQEARWFLKSLLSRNQTLLKVATKIVEVQRNFFEYGEEAMRPLVLRDIAEALEMHESTISRVTTQKYMYTPRGTFEFKYFFSSHVSTAAGGECSATAIRALIKKLVAAEKPSKPLSDNKIASILTDQGINIARRTIAKYREAMAIPPSNERKRLS